MSCFSDVTMMLLHSTNVSISTLSILSGPSAIRTVTT